MSDDHKELCKQLMEMVCHVPDPCPICMGVEAIQQQAQQIKSLEARNLSAIRTMKLIEHATAPIPNDGGGHENAWTLARQWLSDNKWGE